MPASESPNLGQNMEFDTFLLWERSSLDTVDFKKIYVLLTGDLIAGLLLSQIVYYYLPSKDGHSDKLQVRKDGHYWIAKQRDEWWDEVRITAKQADRGLRILEEKGLIVRKYWMLNARRTTHIHLIQDRFLELWHECLELENVVAPATGESMLPDRARPVHPEVEGRY